MPFGKYKNIAHCVNMNRNKKDPEAYCATIMRAMEGKKGKMEGEMKKHKSRMPKKH